MGCISGHAILKNNTFCTFHDTAIMNFLDDFGRPFQGTYSNHVPGNCLGCTLKSCQCNKTFQTLDCPQSNVHVTWRYFSEPLPTSSDTLQLGKRARKLAWRKWFCNFTQSECCNNFNGSVKLRSQFYGDKSRKKQNPLLCEVFYLLLH